jgi:hypothetical protein
MTQKSVYKSAGAIVFAVPPGFAARVSAQPHDLTFGQVGSITTASRLSLHGPEGRSVSSSRVIFAGAAGRGSHCPPIALPAPSSYSSLSQHLQHRVYFRAGAYCNCSWASRLPIAPWDLTLGVSGQVSEANYLQFRVARNDFGGGRHEIRGARLAIGGNGGDP